MRASIAARTSLSSDTAKAQAEELRNQLNELGVEGKAAQVAGIAGVLEETQARTTALTDGLEAAIAAVEAIRTGQVRDGGGGNPLGNMQPPKSELPWTRRPAIPGFTHRKPIAECITAVRREGWPRNAQGKTSARGHLYTGDGHQVNTESFRPHRKGAAPPCEDLREPWRSDEHYTTTWHAERDAAAEMRKWGVSEAVLYLNVPTCGKESGDPLRCDTNLEKILPAEAVLYVWTVHEDGSRSRRRYVGNGEAIDD